MARDPGRRADPDRPDSAEGSPSAVDERFLRAASAAALLRRWLEGGAPRLRSGAPRGPAVNPKQDRSWLRPDLCCGRVARACRQRQTTLTLESARNRDGLVHPLGSSTRIPPRPSRAAALGGWSVSDLLILALTCRQAGRSAPLARGRAGVSSAGSVLRPQGTPSGVSPVANPAADSHLGLDLSGTQAQGRIERSQVATPGVATDSAVEQGLEVEGSPFVYAAATQRRQGAI